MTIDHAYTHFRVQLQVYWADYLGGEPQPLACDEVRWVLPQDLDQFPFPAANTRIIAAIHQALSLSPTPLCQDSPSI